MITTALDPNNIDYVQMFIEYTMIKDLSGEVEPEGDLLLSFQYSNGTYRIKKSELIKLKDEQIESTRKSTKPAKKSRGK